MNKITNIIVGAALAVGGLFGMIADLTAPAQTSWRPAPESPYCVEEDSCTPVYDGLRNRWIIRVDNP